MEFSVSRRFYWLPKILLEDYKNAIKTVAGNKEITFNAFTFGNFEYKLSNNQITRTKTNDCDIKYISKLFGYSYNEEGITVDVKFAYIKEGKAYTLDNKEIGNYEKENQNKILDSGTTKTFIYEKDKNNYYLNKIKKWIQNTKISYQ